MAKAEANRVGLYYYKESSWAETPSTPIMTELPYTGEALKHNKDTVSSATIRADRNTDTLAEVGAGGDGDVNFEFRNSDYIPFIEAALGSVSATATETGAGSPGDIQFAVAGGGVQVITGAPSGWTDNFLVGAWVKISSAAQSANNGIFKITTKAATTLTVANTAGVSENSSTATITQKVIRNGVTKMSFLLEKRFSDISKFQYFKGMRVGQWSMNVASKAVITGAFSFMGAEGIPSATTIGNATSTAKSSDQIINATTNIGSVYEGGSALTTGVKSIDFTVNNNLRALDGIGNRAAIDINQGSMLIEGTMNAYFEDIALLQKFYSHTSSSFSMRLTDEGGKVMIITFPRLYFSEGAPLASGINTDVMIPLKFQAIYDATTACQIQVDIL